MGLALTVVEKVASAKQTDPLDLPPLYNTIDPDHLDELVKSLSDTNGKIEFDYADYSITVTSGGDITAEPIRESEEDQRQESHSSISEESYLRN